MIGLLTEEFGSNLRNGLPHGLSADYQCGDLNVLYSWWLLLRICLSSAADSVTAKKSAEADPSKANEAEDLPVSDT
jgi:hypothetical protein